MFCIEHKVPCDKSCMNEREQKTPLRPSKLISVSIKRLWIIMILLRNLFLYIFWYFEILDVGSSIFIWKVSNVLVCQFTNPLKIVYMRDWVIELMKVCVSQWIGKRYSFRFMFHTFNMLDIPCIPSTWWKLQEIHATKKICQSNIFRLNTLFPFPPLNISIKSFYMQLQP